MKKDGGKANSAGTDGEVFHGFVFNGQDYPPERVEQAVREVQRQLGSAELRHVNDALLARLAEAKKAHGEIPKYLLLDDPAVSTLVNTLALVNQAWITTVIARNMRGQKRLHGFFPEELYSTALTGAGAVGGVMSAILQYDYKTGGVDAFTPYLARAITNAMLPTPRKKGRIAVWNRGCGRSTSAMRREQIEAGWTARRRVPKRQPSTMS